MQFDTLWSYLQEHFQVVLICVGFIVLVGLVVFIGAICDWKWITTSTFGEQSRLALLFSLFGHLGYRIFLGFIGLALLGSGIVMFTLK